MKKSLVLGVLALALIFTVGLTSCASVDQQTLKKAGVPQDQRATLYWVMYDTRLEKIDGKKQGVFVNLYGLLGGLPGVLAEDPGLKEVPLNTRFSVQVSAGEHTIVISDKALIGRKSYEGTFNFEAGKKYIAQLVTPSQYEAMQKPGFDAKGALKDLGNSLKEGLAGNQIIIVAESKKSVPTFEDWNINGTDWKKSIK